MGELIRNRTVRDELQFTAPGSSPGQVRISTVSTGRQRKKKEAKKKEMAATTIYPIPPLTPEGEYYKGSFPAMFQFRDRSQTRVIIITDDSNAAHVLPAGERSCL
jgi:hypothetical protein